MLGDDDMKRKALTDQMRRSFRNWRYRINEKISNYPTIEEALQNCPEDITKENWEACIERYKSEDFQVRSQPFLP